MAVYNKVVVTSTWNLKTYVHNYVNLFYYMANNDCDLDCMFTEDENVKCKQGMVSEQYYFLSRIPNI